MGGRGRKNPILKVFYAAVNGLKWCAALMGWIWLGAQATTPMEGLEGTTPQDHVLAQQVLDLALRNEYQGSYSADLEIIQTSFSSGFEKLVGSLQMDADQGQTRIELKGENQGFTYRSEAHGAEQWVMDETTQRMRRIANRQWKKSAMGTVLSYEDLMCLPGGVLRMGESIKNFQQTDSSYLITMSLNQQSKSFYSKADAVLMKSPLRLSSITLYDNHGKRCKQVDISGYSLIKGQWMFNQYRVVNCDSSAQTFVTLKQPQLPTPSALAMSDHAWSVERKPQMRQELLLQKWVPSPTPFSPQAMPGLDDKTRRSLFIGLNLKQAGQGMGDALPAPSQNQALELPPQDSTRSSTTVNPETGETESDDL